MAFWKYCPVCLEMKIERPIVKTCGDRHCLAIWRTSSNEFKRQMLAAADERKEELLAKISELERMGNFDVLRIPPESAEEAFAKAEAARATAPTRPSILRPPPEAMPVKETTRDRDNEFLRKYAPHLVEEDDKKKED